MVAMRMSTMWTWDSCRWNSLTVRNERTVVQTLTVRSADRCGISLRVVENR